jgi:hypothetical protein
MRRQRFRGQARLTGRLDGRSGSCTWPRAANATKNGEKSGKIMVSNG